MPIAEHISHHGNRGHYAVDDGELAVGSTLGAPKIVAVIKATGAVEKIFDIDAGTVVLGTVMVRHYDSATGAYLEPTPGGRFVLHPGHQEHRFELPNGISVRETIFALNAGSSPDCDDMPPAVYLTISLHNDTERDVKLATYAYAVLRGDTSHDVVVDFDEKLHGLAVWNKSDRNLCRVIGCSRPLAGYEATLDYAKALSDTAPELSDNTSAPYDPLGIMKLETSLGPYESSEFSYCMSVGKGKRKAQSNYRNAPSAGEALHSTTQHYDACLAQSIVSTPNVQVNQGVLWAKANMLRVESCAPTGWCFTNDPARSSNSVARDTAWFGMGADYLDPDFVRASLLAFISRQEANGLIVEYYDIRNGRTEDYGLNINDNTPLLVMALWHHYNVTGDDSFLRDVYPAATKAIGRILAERNEQGLVTCTATGTSDWGIVGWRNVIPNYRLSGSTTELNAECYEALCKASQMARVVGDHAESRRLAGEAESLRSAINRYLRNPSNGLYYLNIDVDGLAHSDITSDLVFPVMFGVADDETASRIVAKLSDRAFWTTGGIRTIPRDAPNYSPNAGSGLLGGVWVGVSFWYAFAAARYSPEWMARALSMTFCNYSVDPRKNNTVPGQFSEWLHGETLTNEGMMLSPWFPPRYLWAAVEGMGGFSVDGGDVAVRPCLPPDWKWLAIRNVPFRGRSLTWVVTRQPDTHIHANFHHVAEDANTTTYSEDITPSMLVSGDSLVGIGMRHHNRTVLFVGNTEDITVTGHVRLVDDALEGAYHVRRFDSLLRQWHDDAELLTIRDLEQGRMIEVESKGFVLLELRQQT